MVVYLDDILVFSKTAKENMEHLKQALQLLKDNKLYARLSKCEFLKEKANFLATSLVQK